MHLDDWCNVRHLLIIGGDPKPEVLSLHSALSMVRRALPWVQLTLLTLEALEFSALEQMHVEAIALFGGGGSHQSLQNGNRFTNSTATYQEDGDNLMRHARTLIPLLRDHQLDAALILTVPAQSPFAWGYLCYLAGIPIRIGQSHEFGGGVLSTCITPPLETVSMTEYYLHLLRSVGLIATPKSQPQLAV
jgi:hypothetical protein